MLALGQTSSPTSKWYTQNTSLLALGDLASHNTVVRILTGDLLGEDGVVNTFTEAKLG